MALTIEKYEFVNGKDDIPYIMENKSHVWNHQPDHLWFINRYHVYQKSSTSAARLANFHDRIIKIWVNYNNSLTWIKAIWGWFPLLTMISRVRSRREVVIIYSLHGVPALTCGAVTFVDSSRKSTVGRESHRKTMQNDWKMMDELWWTEESWIQTWDMNGNIYIYIFR